MSKAKGKNERGVAMFLALFALMLLSAVGFALAFMADTETRINVNFRASQNAYFAARAGLEEGRVRMLPGLAASIAPPAGLPSVAAQNVVYVLNPDDDDDVQPWDEGNPYFDYELCNQRYAGLALTATGNGTPCASAPAGGAWYRTENSFDPGRGTQAALPYKWIRVALKANNTAFPYEVQPGALNTLPVCWDGTRQMLLPAGWTGCEMDPPPNNATYMKNVYVITSYAETRLGSRRMAQMEVANDPPFITNAAVASQASVTLQGSHVIDGYDNCSCQCVGSGATKICTNKAGKICDSTKHSVYSEGNINVNGNTGDVSSGAAPVPGEPTNCDGCAPNQSWPYDINAMIDRYKNSAGVVTPYTNTQCPIVNAGTGQRSCGTQSNQIYGTYPTGLPNSPVGSVPQITYVQGHVQLTAAASGSGILIIDGDLNINGGLNWYGLILVKGVVQFTGGAGQNTNLYGAILAGQTIDSANAVLGGSVDLHYDLCALRQLDNSRPPVMLSSHEKIY